MMFSYGLIDQECWRFQPAGKLRKVRWSNVEIKEGRREPHRSINSVYSLELRLCGVIATPTRRHRQHLG